MPPFVGVGEFVASAAEGLRLDGKRVVIWDGRGSVRSNYMRPPSPEALAIRRPWPGWPLPNVHLLFSAEDQKTFDERARWVLRTPAAVRGVSLEPLLGPIILDDVGGGGHTALTTEIDHLEDTRLDWVIAGGESGPGARPCHPDWIRSIRDQCQEAAVKFFLKQRGEWLPAWEAHDMGIREGRDGNFAKTMIHGFSKIDPAMEVSDVFLRVGKKAAGRELDGRTWDEFPEVAR